MTDQREALIDSWSDSQDTAEVRIIKSFYHPTEEVEVRLRPHGRWYTAREWNARYPHMHDDIRSVE